MMKLFSMFAAVVLVSASAFGQSLGVGDPAPKLSVSEWVKGEPVISFEEGRVYVVEFWATWCPPCLKSIPHLTELQTEHAEHLTVVGMTSEDSRGNSLAKVKSFVGDWGDKMGYTVAFDNKRETNTAYMAAAAQRGIPTAFVIDQKGMLAWIGNPLDPQFDTVLEGVIGGEFDVAEQKRISELQRRANTLMQQANKAYSAGDHETVLAKFDEVIALDHEVFGQAAVQKVAYLMFEVEDADAANAYAAEATKTVLQDQGALLNQLAWMMVSEGGERADLDVALASVRRANELSDGENPAVLDTLAAVHWARGDKEEAVTFAERAAASAEDGEREAIETKLETYRGG